MYMFIMLKQKSGKLMEIPKSFLGYKRENGRAGTRNHVIILPVDDISNACAEAVANNIKGTIALPCLLYTSPSPRDRPLSRMPSSA